MRKGPENIAPDPTAIGNVATPPFVRLPDPYDLFARRAARFRAYGEGHDLAPYMAFLAGLADIQAQIQAGLPAPAMPEAQAVARARQNKMPPLDRSRLAADPTFDATLARLIAAAQSLAMPEPAGIALRELARADAGMLRMMCQNVLADSIPIEGLASHAFVAAALQVHFARLAARLDPESLVAIGDGLCPVCGGPPISTVIVGWENARGTRFCACSLCATLWNYARVKCAVCGSSKDVAYQEVAGGAGTIKAETCGTCRSYVKILHQHTDPGLDPVVDDVGSLGLDLLVRELGFSRGGLNPFLLGY
jgi:FdhE protein